jgi:hypothetical protein
MLKNFQLYFFLEILLIKTLNPDWIRICIRIQIHLKRWIRIHIRILIWIRIQLIQIPKTMERL